MHWQQWPWETSYYIGSIASIVGVFIKSVRSHWAIENSLHWVTVAHDL